MESKGISESQRYEARRCHALRAKRFCEIPHGLLDSFCRQLKGSKMHGDALRCFEIQVSPNSLSGIHMDYAHEPSRLVGANRQQREVDRTKAPPHVAKE